MLGSILKGVGAVAGAFGGGKSQQTAQSISGFQSLPKEIQEYLTGDIFTRIQDYGQTPYPQVPYRRVDDREMDPIFGSRALRDLQNLRDMQAMSQFTGQAQPATDEAQTVNQLRKEMEARDFLSRQAMMANQKNPGAGDRMMRYSNQIAPEQLGDLGSYLTARGKAKPGEPYYDDFDQATLDLVRLYQGGF